MGSEDMRSRIKKQINKEWKDATEETKAILPGENSLM